MNHAGVKGKISYGQTCAVQTQVVLRVNCVYCELICVLGYWDTLMNKHRWLGWSLLGVGWGTGFQVADSVTVSAGLAGTRELLWESFLKPHHSHGLITSVVLPTNTTTWALRFQHLPLGGTQTFRPQQLYSFAIYIPWGCRQTSHNKIKCASKLHDIFISHWMPWKSTKHRAG